MLFARSPRSIFIPFSRPAKIASSLRVKSVRSTSAFLITIDAGHDASSDRPAVVRGLSQRKRIGDGQQNAGRRALLLCVDVSSSCAAAASSVELACALVTPSGGPRRGLSPFTTACLALRYCPACALLPTLCAAARPLTPTCRVTSSCFVGLVFGILWPTAENGRKQRPNLSAYKKGAAMAAKKD